MKNTWQPGTARPVRTGPVSPSHQGNPLPLIVFDRSETVTEVNPACETWLGLRDGEGKPLSELLPDVLYAQLRGHIQKVMQTGSDRMDAVLHHGGSNIECRVLLNSAGSDPDHFVLTAIPYQLVRMGDKEQSVAAKYLRYTFDAIDQGVTIYDAEFRLVAWNTAYEQMQIVPPECMRYRYPLFEAFKLIASRGLFGPGDPEEQAQNYIELIRNRKIPPVEDLYPPSGRIIQIRRYYLPSGGMCAVFTDITESRKSEQLLEYQANTDELCRVPNRFCFISKLRQALAEAGPDERVILIFIDLDRFKLVNDSYGHSAGDELLQQTARRLKGMLRHEDGVDVVARTGGDEFVVMLRSEQSDTKAELLCARICQGLSRPFLIQGTNIYISASVGMSIYPDQAGTAEELLTRADSALYRAKRYGDTYEVYDDLLGNYINKRTFVANALRHELRQPNDRLRVELQPIVDLTSGQIVGAEALLRWDGLEEHHLTVPELIEILENYNLILDVGGRVTRLALSSMAEIARYCPDFYLSFNVSPLQIAQPGFAASVINLVYELSLDAGNVCIEITESALMQEIANVDENMRQLRNAGIRLAIDDFGTGFSSLAYIKKFPFTQIKIDRSFVMEVPDNPEHCYLIKAIVDISHAFDVRMVAEGIETEAQRRFLLQQGIQHGQGFLFDRPMPVQQLLMRYFPDESLSADAAG